MRLPGVVIPGMQADLVAGFGGGPDYRRQPVADERAGPERAAKEDVPPIEIAGAASEHLGQERGAEEPPEVAAHVVGADGEEERRLDAVCGKKPA